VRVDSATHDGAAFNLTTTSSFGTASNSIAFGFDTPDWVIYHDGSSSGQRVSSGPSAATWYHVATVFDGNDLVYYVNGNVLLTKSSHSGSIPSAGYSHVMIGGYYSTSFLLDGRIEDFRVTKGVARDIAADWTAGVYNSALPQGAAVAGTTNVPTTGVLSLAELLQASYGVAAAVSLSADILVVGGGAGGAEADISVTVGNGGSGGAVTLASAYDLGTSAITISVGAGGTAPQDSNYNDPGGAGGQSAFGVITAAGAPENVMFSTASSQQTSFTNYGGSTTTYTTTESGAGTQSGTPYDGLNGAGAGGNATTTAGGNGYLWSVTNTRYGAGGGAARFNNSTRYVGGSGGGGSGGYSSGASYYAATAATGYGSGGGGGYLTGYPSDGTAGVVLVYLSGTTYTLSEAQAAFTGSNSDVAVSTPAGGGTLITFTGNGDWTPPTA
ncbi:MAG: glycine-rich domain-containing protein, partial [Halioglobus sp.]